MKPNPQIAITEARKLYEAARDAMTRESWTYARSLLEQSYRKSVHFKTLELLGECCVKLGQNNEAILYYAAATALNNQPKAPSILAQLLAESGDAHAAARIARQVLAVSPGNRMARRVLESLEDPADAQSGD
jgi:tetratricopeptide (TPR) repeat protein